MKVLGNGLRPPAKPGDAGMDLVAEHDFQIPPHDHAVIGTGTHVRIPPGFVGMVCSRSGLAANEGVFVLNSPGIIDNCYTGELKAILANLNGVTKFGKAGDKIAQLLVVPFVVPTFEHVDSIEELGVTERGSTGFGSSGVSI